MTCGSSEWWNVSGRRDEEVEVEVESESEESDSVTLSSSSSSSSSLVSPGFAGLRTRSPWSSGVVMSKAMWKWRSLGHIGGVEGFVGQ